MICLVFVNASVLIPLAKIGKLELLKKYFKEIKITGGIKEELLSFNKAGAAEIEKAAESWIKEEKSANELTGVKNLSQKEEISIADAELVLSAKKRNEKILTNDYRLHIVAKSKGVETEWLTTFLLKCVKKKLLTKKHGKEVLFELIESGMRLNVEVYAAIEKKIDEI
ncbi:MAG: hypothetical protein HYW50_01900 [Candidatus Diapherotrites archaeon]|nr:hypothetical protein [Candidatus Diapherotrites archaeon]